MSELCWRDRLTHEQMNSGRHECARHARRQLAALLALAVCALAPPFASAKLSMPRSASTPSTERSDSTSSTTLFSYDRLGNVLSATVAGVSTNLYSYDFIRIFGVCPSFLLCKKSKEGSMSSSFQSLAYGCNVNDFCCRNSGDNCAIQDVPSCLMGALAAAWNNGIAIADLDHIVRNSKNAVNHAANGMMIDGYLNNFCE